MVRVRCRTDCPHGARHDQQRDGRGERGFQRRGHGALAEHAGARDHPGVLRDWVPTERGEQSGGDVYSPAQRYSARAVHRNHGDASRRALHEIDRG